jgi:epoxyqueuosine reductase
MSASVKDQIIARAKAEGFDAAGIAPASGSEETATRLRAFVEAGHHGTMGWMEESLERRSAPQAMWAGARSAVMLGMNYGPNMDVLSRLENKNAGVISVYALGHDYHDLIKKKLKRVARWMAETQNCAVKVFVDTAPLMEKPLAARAGLGWQGKHTNLVSRQLGSWLLLGAILTDMEIEPDEEEPDHCGQCRACLDICPTNAFPGPYSLDARRCISYLTIEHKGHIAPDLRKAMGNRIFGCDDCLAVCPWNKFAVEGREAKLAARDALRSPDLEELAGLDDAQFRNLFTANPVKRSGRDRFVRNVLIAVGNSGDMALSKSAIKLLDDASPLVRAMAVWACGQLLSGAAMGGLRSDHMSDESDPGVLAEWERAP